MNLIKLYTLLEYKFSINYNQHNGQNQFEVLTCI